MGGRRRRRRQSAFRGTAYNEQDAKFARVENTIPTAINFDDSLTSGGGGAPNLNTQPLVNSANAVPRLYWPYRTATDDQGGDFNTNAAARQLFEDDPRRAQLAATRSLATNRQQSTFSPLQSSPQLADDPRRRQLVADQPTAAASLQRSPSFSPYVIDPNRRPTGPYGNQRQFDASTHGDIQQYDGSSGDRRGVCRSVGLQTFDANESSRLGVATMCANSRSGLARLEARRRRLTVAETITIEQAGGAF